MQGTVGAAKAMPRLLKHVSCRWQLNEQHLATWRTLLRKVPQQAMQQRMEAVSHPPMRDYETAAHEPECFFRQGTTAGDYVAGDNAEETRGVRKRSTRMRTTWGKRRTERHQRSVIH
jgi:carboxylesterase type B